MLQRPGTKTADGPSLSHVLSRLAVVEALVRAAIATRRTGTGDHPAPDPFRGLYLSDTEIDRLLAAGPGMAVLSGAGPGAAGLCGAGTGTGTGTGTGATGETAQTKSTGQTGDTGRIAQTRDTGDTGDTAQMLAAVEEAADRAASAGARLRLRDLAGAFGLLPLDIALLLVALAPEVDPRFERLYGYLHDDLTRRRPTIGLALELAGVPAAAASGRARLRPGCPLLDHALIEVLEGDRPFLTRSLRIPDRVVAHLLGDDTPDPALHDLLATPPPCLAGDPGAMAAALRAGASLGYVTEHRTGSAPALGAAAFATLGLPSVVLDLGRLAGRDPVAVAAIARREARLRGAGLVAGPVEALGDATSDQLPGRVSAWTDPTWPVILFGRRTWDPLWSAQVPAGGDAP
ncbi:MAG TPA: hypothetical protein VFP72_13785, partial [Kineosporiaceae bacterium]|nr:hypothetical protein [Kineosporiaceae bacterium]